MAQFVPVKLDIASEEYGHWRRDHSAEGTSIPKLFVVRADGETLYAKSGSLKGIELPMMLANALRHSGKILSSKDAIALTEAADNFASLKAEGEIEDAVKALSKVRKIGEPGKIASYSASALRLNQLVAEESTQVSNRLDELGTAVEEGKAEAKLNAILEYLKIRREYGALKMLKPRIAEFQKQFTTKDNGQLTREAKVIDEARAANSKSRMQRATEKLTELIAATEIESVRSAAETALEKLRADED